MKNQAVTYAELNLQKDQKRLQREAQDSKRSSTVAEQEITYTELNLQNASRDPQGHEHQYHYRGLPSGLEKFIAGFLGFLCLVLMISIITVYFYSELQKSKNPTVPKDPGTQQSKNLTVPKECHCDRCPKEWLMYSNNCYYISDEKKTRNQSLMDCSNKKSKLLNIDNEEKVKFCRVLNILPWSGLSRGIDNNAWVWPDGTPLSSEGFSVANETNENCAYIDTSRKKYFPVSCFEKRTYVCMKEII